MAMQKIMVVEDEEDILELLLFTLRRDDNAVTGAKSGEEAIAILGRETFDLILLDIMLPQKNGFEVLAFLQALSTGGAPHTPVILLSAMTNSESIVKGLNEGAVDYITKPFSINELAARVKLHLQLKATSDKLRRSEERLRRSLAAKEKFFRIIAHDLRGPVSALHGYAKLLSNRHHDWPMAKQEQCMQTMEKTSANISTLLEKLLQWAQSQSDNLAMHPEPLNLLTICDETWQPLSGQAESKNIRLEMEIPPEATVYADHHALSTVFRNLLANAIKYTWPGGKVTVSARFAGDREEISITDSGVGIAEDDLEKVFRIDTHHSTPGTDNEKGSGLGLILCREFIEKNNGQIKVRSTRGTGTTFIFTLPHAAAADTFGKIHPRPGTHPEPIQQRNHPGPGNISISKPYRHDA